MQSKNEKLDNLVYCGRFCGCCFEICFLLLFQIKELACKTINTQNPFNNLKKINISEVSWIQVKTEGGKQKTLFEQFDSDKIEMPFQ